MAILLNIDTAVETASVCISDNDKTLTIVVNENQRDHASWLHTAIKETMKVTGVSVRDLNGVAVSIGPGSYTGLRIGLSAAKGLCYALEIPLISINSLQMMAHAVATSDADLICPLIDARRMEVFAAVYNKSLEEVIKPFATIVVNNSFSDILSSHRVIFSGNGSKKLQEVLSHPNAVFSEVVATAADLPFFSYKKFREKSFADLAYIEPDYVKDFHSATH